MALLKILCDTIVWLGQRFNFKVLSHIKLFIPVVFVVFILKYLQRKQVTEVLILQGKMYSIDSLCN